mmetsp:Transcript_22197/g.49375  ORF Transcript_22197/g.49375 Transcript_22197/m.49375 type:complete len:239 (-) Transcript_22197:4486-5202(-)
MPPSLSIVFSSSALLESFDRPEGAATATGFFSLKLAAFRWAVAAQRWARELARLVVILILSSPPRSSRLLLPSRAGARLMLMLVLPAPCLRMHSSAVCSSISLARTSTPQPSSHLMNRSGQVRVMCTPRRMAGTRSPQVCLQGTRRKRQVKRSCWSRSSAPSSFRHPCTRQNTLRCGHCSRSCCVAFLALTCCRHREQRLVRSGQSYLRCRAMVLALKLDTTRSETGTFSSSTHLFSH